MTGKAVAVQEASAVPALIQTPALQIDASDIALSRIYSGQFMSQAVQNGIVKLGDIYAAPSADDDEPEVLWEQADRDTDPGVLFHVIHMVKRLSIQDDSGGLVLFDFGDPAAPADANVTYNYTLVLPEHDVDVPYRLTLTRSGSKAARNINTALLRAAHTTPAFGLAFRLTYDVIKGKKGTYAEARVKLVDDPNPDHVALAEKMFLAVNQAAPAARVAVDEPTI